MVIQNQIRYVLGFWRTRVGKCSASELRSCRAARVCVRHLHINTRFPRIQPSCHLSTGTEVPVSEMPIVASRRQAGCSPSARSFKAER